MDTPVKAYDFKSLILNTLQLLPISNKTILQDSKVLSVVEKWVMQSAEAAKEKAAGEESDSSVGTPKHAESATSSSQSTPRAEYELTLVPHKKRKMLERLKQQEEASSSEGEMSDTSKTNANLTEALASKADQVDSSSDIETVNEGAAGQSPVIASEQDSKPPDVESESAPADAGKDPSTEESAEDSKAEASDSADGNTVTAQEEKDQNVFMNMATNVLDSWNNLKEIFKIPKIQVEERKKIEQELGKSLVFTQNV